MKCPNCGAELTWYDDENWYEDDELFEKKCLSCDSCNREFAEVKVYRLVYDRTDFYEVET